jgi:flavin-dependent dehydrogenase
MIDHEAVVVGAGPAGIVAGIVLARSGIDTLVCDRNRLPIDKACGEGILPIGVRTLHALGVLEHLPEANCHPFVGIRYIAPSGRTAQVEFAEGAGLGVERVALSTALAERARRESRLTLLDRCAVQVHTCTRQYIALGAGERIVRTRLLIGADGLYSRIRRWAKLDARPPRSARWGLRQRLRQAPWSNCVEVYFAGGIEAYVTPTAPEQISVAFLWDEHKLGLLRQRIEPDRLMLERCPELRARMSGATILGPARSAGPLERRVTCRIADGLILIGDAAGYVDAATGEGISLALAEALTLPKTVVPALRRARSTGRVPARRDLLAYEHALTALYRPYSRWSRLVVTLGSHRYLSERVIAALSESPAAFQHLLSASMGEKPLWALAPRAAFPLLLAMLR